MRRRSPPRPISWPWWCRRWSCSCCRWRSRSCSGVVLYGGHDPENWPGFFLAILLGAAAFAGLGFGAAALIRSAEGSSAVVNLIVLPMAFLSGSFGPTREYPDVLQAVADVLPLTYLIEIFKNVYLRGESFWHDPTAILVVVAWGVGGLLVARRWFGWMPRER